MSAVSSNRVDELANSLARQGRAAEIVSQLNELDRSDFSEAENESYYHARGITALSRGDRPLALSRFKEAHQAFPKSAMIAFSLGQEYEHIGDIEPAFQLFDRALFPAIPAKYALAESRYAYLWNNLKRATAYIEPILAAHFDLRIADDTFLWLRRMPFFSQTWAYMAAFCELTGDLKKLEEITEKASSRLEDFDVSPLADFLSCMRRDDFSKYEALSDDETGYQRTRAAVVYALYQKDYVKAQAALTSVRFSDHDFPHGSRTSFYWPIVKLLTV